MCIVSHDSGHSRRGRFGRALVGSDRESNVHRRRSAEHASQHAAVDSKSPTSRRQNGDAEFACDRAGRPRYLFLSLHAAMKTSTSTWSRPAFTLVELLVCIAIIGMLVML